jgi:hypothetical protein
VTTWGYISGSENHVCGGDLGVILTLKKNLNALKCFDLEKYRIKLALSKLAQKIHQPNII